ncbi:MAG: hypothetical protein WCA49_01225, partial [Candidatus Sulfotelmatobacter sp.]
AHQAPPDGPSYSNTDHWFDLFKHQTGLYARKREIYDKHLLPCGIIGMVKPDRQTDTQVNKRRKENDQ